jgi:hypothetical protein
MRDQNLEESMKRYKEAVERIRSGESDFEEVDLHSGRVRLTRDRTAPSGIKIHVLETRQEDHEPQSMDQDRKETFRLMKEATERLQSGASKREEITFPSGRKVVLEADEEVSGAFRMRESEGGMAMRSVPFQPSSTRPADYPEDMPFLPECAVSLIEVGDGSSRTMTWYAPPDPEAALAELRLQLTREGWSEAGESEASTTHGTARWSGFEKGGLSRLLSLSRFGEHCQMVMVERPHREGESDS